MFRVTEYKNMHFEAFLSFDCICINLEELK